MAEPHAPSEIHLPPPSLAMTLVPSNDRSVEPKPVRRRWTRHTSVILDVLRRHDRFRTAQQLYDEIRDIHSISVWPATLYRTLHRLEEQQLVEVERAESGELMYRIGGGSVGHHNLVCRACGRAERFTAPNLERLANRLAQQFDFVDITRRFIIYGICDDCNTTRE